MTEARITKETAFTFQEGRLFVTIKVASEPGNAPYAWMSIDMEGAISKGFKIPSGIALDMAGAFAAHLERFEDD